MQISQPQMKSMSRVAQQITKDPPGVSGSFLYYPEFSYPEFSTFSLLSRVMFQWPDTSESIMVAKCSALVSDRQDPLTVWRNRQRIKLPSKLLQQHVQQIPPTVESDLSQPWSEDENKAWLIEWANENLMVPNSTNDQATGTNQVGIAFEKFHHLTIEQNKAVPWYGQKTSITFPTNFSVSLFL